MAAAKHLVAERTSPQDDAPLKADSTSSIRLQVQVSICDTKDTAKYLPLGVGLQPSLEHGLLELECTDRHRLAGQDVGHQIQGCTDSFHSSKVARVATEEAKAARIAAEEAAAKTARVALEEVVADKAAADEEAADEEAAAETAKVAAKEAAVADVAGTRQHWVEAAASQLVADITHPTIHQVQVSTDKASVTSAYLPKGRVATSPLAAEPTQSTPYEAEAAASAGIQEGPLNDDNCQSE